MSVLKPAALAVAAVLALTACSTYDDPAAEPAVTATATAAATAASAEASAADSTAEAAATVSPGTVSPSSTADLATWDVPVSVDDAVGRAEGAADGTLYQLELEHSARYRAWVYKVSFLSGTTDTTVVIDAVSGDIIANEKDTEDDDDDRGKAIDVTQMTPADAMAKAQKVLSGTVAEWSLEWDDDVQAYTVDIRQGGDDTEDVTVETKSGRAHQD